MTPTEARELLDAAERALINGAIREDLPSGKNLADVIARLV